MGYDEMANYFDDKKIYDLMFSGGIYYWLASRYANCISVYAHFGLRRVDEGNLYSNYLFSSSGSAINFGCYGLRAVVSLGSKVKFVNGDGREEHEYELEI